MAKRKTDKRTVDYKENQLGTIVRIKTSYLVEVSDKDLSNIKKIFVAFNIN